MRITRYDVSRHVIGRSDLMSRYDWSAVSSLEPMKMRMRGGEEKKEEERKRRKGRKEGEERKDDERKRRMTRGREKGGSGCKL